MTGDQLLIKTIKQCNAFEARVIELELQVKYLTDQLKSRDEAFVRMINK